MKNYEEDDEKRVREIFDEMMDKRFPHHKSVDEFVGRIRTELSALEGSGTLKGKGGSETHKDIDMTEDMARVLTMAKDYTDKVFDNK